MAKTLKLISWNVNGIRSCLEKGFCDFVAKEKPDILCLQEVRANPEVVVFDLPGYDFHWNWNRLQTGYSGTAIFTKIKPISVMQGMQIPKHDKEARVITAEYPNFFLVDVYVPNSKRDLSRLPYREKEWDVDFLAYLKKLEKTKPVITCGDFNVAHKESDLAHPETNHRNHGFTDEERAGFENLVKSGFMDTFRELHDGNGHYTWWSPFANCRKRNLGWRIDYFLISKSLRTRLEDAFILPEVTGSDHCPVGITIKE